MNNIKYLKKHKYDLKKVKKYIHDVQNKTATKCDAESFLMTTSYFLCGIMKICGELNQMNKYNLISFVSQCQVLNKENFLIGFKGSTHNGSSEEEDLASTYSALCILQMCDIDTTSENIIEKSMKVKFKKEIFIHNIVKHFHPERGTFTNYKNDSEDDVRFLYCGLCIFKMIDITLISTCLSVEKIKEYLKSIRTYEGGYSMVSDSEANGGTTYCALASYFIIDSIEEVMNNISLLSWLISRCSNPEGVNGRTNKQCDSCYTYWIYSSLTIIKKNNLVDNEFLASFINKCQTIFGGYSKYSNINEKGEDIYNYPDIEHTYYSLLSLCLSKEININIDPILSIPK